MYFFKLQSMPLCGQGILDERSKFYVDVERKIILPPPSTYLGYNAQKITKCQPVHSSTFDQKQRTTTRTSTYQGKMWFIFGVGKKGE